MRRKRIAFVVNALEEAYQLAFRAAVEGAARQAGFDLLAVVGRQLEEQHPHSRAMNAAYEWLTSEAVEGVILLSAAMANHSGADAVLTLVDKLRPLPVCSIGVVIEGVPSILLDNAEGMRAATQHLIEVHGCRQIAYISGPANNPESIERLEGYRSALAQAGLNLDPERICYGAFSRESGVTAVDELMARGVRFDAVIAANDYMALGAMEALGAHGRDVPSSTPVVGFDDSAVARYARHALSSVAQPIEQMATRAVELIATQVEGIVETRAVVLSPRLVVRESCGCGELDLRPASGAASGDASVPLLLDGALAELGSTAAWTSSLRGWTQAPLERAHEPFLLAVDRAVDQCFGTAEIGELEAVLNVLTRRAVEARVDDEGMLDIERGRSLVAAAARRGAGREGLQLAERAGGLRHISQGLSASLELGVIAQGLLDVLGLMGVRDALFATLVESEQLCSWLMLREGVGDLQHTTYPLESLLPDKFLGREMPHSVVLMPLTYEADVLGLLAVGGCVESYVVETLRAQLSAGVKLARLHSQVVGQTALRQRLHAEGLNSEMAVARRIQSALAPRHFDGLGLEVFGCMRAADRVGGDYFDVFPVAGGCWLAIGDVTGHGLMAGLIMLMLQSAVSAVVRSMPDARPSAIVAKVNEVLRPNIRERLGENEHVTFALVHYRDSGVALAAGAHEDLLVARAGAKAIESVALDGMWLGILEDVSDVTHDVEFFLNPGDTLVLLTDGIAEERNAHGEVFGEERVARIVEESASAGPEALCQALVSASLAWSALQQDDMTVLVARRPG